MRSRHAPPLPAEPAPQPVEPEVQPGFLILLSWVKETKAQGQDRSAAFGRRFDLGARYHLQRPPFEAAILLETTMPRPKWYELALAERGVKEAEGAADNPKVQAYYRDAGHPEAKHDLVPWCAAFVGAMLKRAGIKPSGELSACSDLLGARSSPRPAKVALSCSGSLQLRLARACHLSRP